MAIKIIFECVTWDTSRTFALVQEITLIFDRSHIIFNTNFLCKTEDLIEGVHQEILGEEWKKTTGVVMMAAEKVYGGGKEINEKTVDNTSSGRAWKV